MGVAIVHNSRGVNEGETPVFQDCGRQGRPEVGRLCAEVGVDIHLKSALFLGPKSR